MKVFLSTFFLSLFFGAAAHAYGSIDNNGTRCYRNSNTCSTDISWYTNARNAVVTVVTQDGRNGRVEKLFACGRDGRQHANWIRPGQHYTFNLYTGRCPRNTYPRRGELGQRVDSTHVFVRNGQGSGYSDLSARILGRTGRNGSNYRAAITWSAETNRRGTGVVTVQVAGRQGDGRESLFACGNEGRQIADWIRPNARYVFRLYEGRDCPRSGRYPRPGELGEMTERLRIVDGRVMDRR